MNKKKLFTMKVEPEVLEKWHIFAKSKNKPLSDIIKILMSNQKLPENVPEKKEQKEITTKVIKIVDPNLMKELNAIGNNINQISRRLNQNEKFDLKLELYLINRKLERLLNAHQIS